MIYTGLTVYIYNNQFFSKCSANGISERYKEALIICKGVVEIDTENLEKKSLPVIQLVEKKLCGETVYIAKVVFDPDFPKLNHSEKWAMMGGAFIYSSDSRFREMFPFYGAIPLHDRYED